MLVIYIQLCRCDISLWKCNVSRQEASRHVLSTSLCFSCSPSLSLPLISSTNLSHKTLSLPAFHPNPFRHQPVQLCFNMTASTHTHTTSQRQIWAISHVFTQQHSHVGCLNLFGVFTIMQRRPATDRRSSGSKGNEATNTYHDYRHLLMRTNYMWWITIRG